jgi:8-oxo-dGTP diphosphatase
MPDRIVVVCGVIFQEGKIFIARRRQGRSMSGKWEFPGGKIETNESPEKALQRELIEELDLEVEISSLLGSVEYSYSSFSIRLIAYKCFSSASPMHMTDHDMFEWVIPEQLLKYDLTEADIELIPVIMNDLRLSEQSA